MYNCDFQASHGMCLSDHSIRPAPAMNDQDEYEDEEEMQARENLKSMQIVVKKSDSSQNNSSLS